MKSARVIRSAMTGRNRRQNEGIMVTLLVVTHLINGAIVIAVLFFRAVDAL
jgi:hypothetical protein